MKRAVGVALITLALVGCAPQAASPAPAATPAPADSPAPADTPVPGDTPAPSPVEPVATQPPPGGDGGASVSIIDFNFDPATVTVSVNDVVTWTHAGAAPHTVTFEEGPDSGALEAGETFEHAFSAPGEYTYICTIHPAMRGVVNVGP